MNRQTENAFGTAGLPNSINKANAVVWPVLFMLLAAPASAQADYLCITEQVTGFSHDVDRDAWVQVNFLPGERFTISARGPGAYQIKKQGEHNIWSAKCTLRDDQSDDSFSCRSGTNELHFNRKTLRFTSMRYFGYWNGSSDSISVAIGRCFAD